MVISDISIGAIIFKENNPLTFLILKRTDNGLWEFPKGHQRENETELETLKRELNEEIGTTQFFVFEDFKETISYLSSRGVQRVIIFYLVSIVAEPLISPEHCEYKWISLNEAFNYFKHSDMIDLLKKSTLKMNVI